MNVLVLGMSDNMGGIETYLYNLVRYFDREQVALDFVCEKKKLAFEEELREKGCQIHYIPWRRKKLIEHMRELHRLVKEHKEYSVIYINAMSAACLPSVLALNGLNRRIIFHSRNNKTKYLFIHQMLRPFLNLHLNERWACSELAGRYMFGKRKFRVISNGIDFERFCYQPDLRPQLRDEFFEQWFPKSTMSANTFILGFVGNLTYQKNPMLLIQIFHKLCEQNKQSVLLIVGDGELYEEVMKLAKTLGVDHRIAIVGKQKKVEDYYQIMDAFILPSRYEGFGNVLIEAQAAGLPCIASKGVIPESTRISNRIQYIGLNDDLENWVHAILRYQSEKRHGFNGNPVDTGHEVVSAVKKVQKLMLNQEKKI